MQQAHAVVCALASLACVLAFPFRLSSTFCCSVLAPLVLPPRPCARGWCAGRCILFCLRVICSPTAVLTVPVLSLWSFTPFVLTSRDLICPVFVSFSIVCGSPLRFSLSFHFLFCLFSLCCAPLGSLIRVSAVVFVYQAITTSADFLSLGCCLLCSSAVGGLASLSGSFISFFRLLWLLFRAFSSYGVSGSPACHTSSCLFLLSFGLSMRFSVSRYLFVARVLCASSFCHLPAATFPPLVPGSPGFRRFLRAARWLARSRSLRGSCSWFPCFISVRSPPGACHLLVRPRRCLGLSSLLFRPVALSAPFVRFRAHFSCSPHRSLAALVSLAFVAV